MFRFFLVVALAAVPLLAQDGPQLLPLPPERPQRPIVSPTALAERYIGLSEQDVRFLKSLQAQAARQAAALARRGAEIRARLMELRQSEDPDMDLMNQLLRDLQRVQNAINQVHSDYREQAIRSLSPEQQEKLADLQMAWDLAAAARQAGQLNLIEGAPTPIPVPPPAADQQARPLRSR